VDAGTIMGVSRFLKSKNPDIQIVGLQPSMDASIAGIRRWPVEYLPSIFEVLPDRVLQLSVQAWSGQGLPAIHWFLCRP